MERTDENTDPDYNYDYGGEAARQESARALRALQLQALSAAYSSDAISGDELRVTRNAIHLLQQAVIKDVTGA